MTARPRFTERQRAQVRAARRGLPDVTGAKRFENRGPAVVHADDHRRRSTFLRETSHDSRGPTKAKAEAPDLRRTDRTEETCGSEGVHSPFGKRTLPIDRCRVRRDDVGTDFFQC